MVGKLRIIWSQTEPCDYLLFQKTPVGGLKARREFHNEFIKRRAVKTYDIPGFLQFGFKILGLVIVETGKFPYARPSHRGHIHGSCQGAKAIVGADVGSRFLPSNMLFPGSQGQNKASLAVQVFGKAHQAAG